MRSLLRRCWRHHSKTITRPAIFESQFYSPIEGMATMDAAESLAKPTIDHEGNFNNPWSGWKDTTPLAMLHWRFVKNRGGHSGGLEAVPKPSKAEWACAFPVTPPDFSKLRSDTEAVKAIWIGHASLLVQLGKLTFLTDPVFSERCSPLTFLGPKRLVPTPFQLSDSDLPNIDAVLISHNHYDHLDYPTVKQLHKRFGNSLKWYCPLKLGKWFVSCGILEQNVVELDWWQEVQHSTSGIIIALTPAQHWSNRGLDRRKSLWGGFAVFNQQLRFYFAGDTGYCPVFKQIGRQYGPFDLAAIPVGAYFPSELWAAQHCNPEEAVAIHKDVQSKRSLGIHCCTFAMTDEPLDEPPKRVRAASRAEGLADDEFIVMQHGGLISTADGKDYSVPPML